MLMFLFIIINVSNYCQNERILGIIPTPGYSHQIVYRPIWHELANRGHEVVVMTTNPTNNTTSKIKELDVHEAYGIWKPYIASFSKSKNPVTIAMLVKRLTTVTSKFELDLPDMQILLKNQSEHFDLVMAEMSYPVMFGLAEKYKCPLIALLTTDMSNNMYTSFGSPVHPIAYPDILTSFRSGNMTFWERIASTLYLPLYKLGIIFSYEIIMEENRIIKEYFKSELSATEIINRKMSLVFVNSVPTLNVRPVPPSIINIGGNLHVGPNEKLPKEYQDFLDSASNGAIYFSLGTNVKSHVVPPDMREAFLNAFRELPYKIVWKFDIVDLPNVPKNVKIVEWAPQQDILRHPNIKLFMFQGGLQSYEEAVYNKIPLVGIPFLGDQNSNVGRLVGNGYGVKIDKNNVTKESVIEAIEEVMNNPSYKQKITEMSELIADQPMTGLEKAVWWTEYVLRHKGAYHLRTPVMDLPFYQYYLLDVFGFLFGCSVIVIVFIYILCKLSRRALFKSQTQKVKVK